jgi:isochorismate pyruvate lyase
VALTPAKDCASMVEVRAEIDRIDRELVALIAERMTYIDAAARIKQARDAVRDEDRKADVLAKVAAASRAMGAPEALTADLWDRMVEYSIAHEFVEFDAKS